LLHLIHSLIAEPCAKSTEDIAAFELVPDCVGDALHILVAGNVGVVEVVCAMNYVSEDSSGVLWSREYAGEVKVAPMCFECSQGTELY
jgi:thiamine pyrophosphate-dependent acetolactate synthase large subunit-like protein